MLVVCAFSSEPFLPVNGRLASRFSHNVVSVTVGIGGMGRSRALRAKLESQQSTLRLLAVSRDARVEIFDLL
jgi:hypothetical protein